MKIIFLIFLLFSAVYGFNQSFQFNGHIASNGRAVSFAKVILSDRFSVLSNEEGDFSFENIPLGEYELNVKAVGYKDFQQKVNLNKNITDLQIELEDNELQLNTVVVTGTMRETSIANSPVKIEVLSQSFFKGSPVYSVIEAMQTVNGVQEQVNCGVCGTNDIHINGMEGPYTLVLIDGMPIVSGLSSVYGFNGIPTSLIDRVEIVKGPSSTLYGTEAVGGVVNIITKSPEESALFEVDANYNTHQELTTDFSITPQLSKRVFTTFSGDYYFNNRKLDHNQDGFTDIPLNNRISLFNKWQFKTKDNKDLLNLAARYYFEDRFGGVLHWTKEDRASDSVYGESILTKRVELIGSFIIPTVKRNFKLDFSANYHEQDSYYGDVSYKAQQQVYFSNFVWSQKLAKRHYMIAGLSNRYQIYQDNTPSNTDENTYVPGVFIQDEFDVTDRLKLLGGVRLDYHFNHGLIFSPRFSLKQQFGSTTALRFNYGTGFRQVHLFTEDHAFVSGARDVVILEELKPERSHNATLNFNHSYAFKGYGNFDLDLFYTYFQNKIIPDFDQNPNLIVYQNLSGYGISRGISASINHAFSIPLRVRMGVTLMEVFEMTKDSNNLSVKEQQFFAPKFSGTFGVNFNWKKIGLEFAYQGRVMGPQRLPDFAEPFDRPDQSPWYTIQNVQVTKSFKNINLELYTGIKNIFNYTQPSPLIDPMNPYGDNFDTSYAFGPLQVRRFFLGIRWNIKRK
ncbi:TonB-dependent receptor [Paracrocinitomix mangrovi]|uniref:TonB-dependent receptor n=1 Tax=Paracrocinitomix mangrovi TaxID=2862509 RepID=UPI001C8F1C75|nr:TonB-dependent receptor [Paracrocinitomix mangrovi]UKN02893.1 TonB-dependent receptor [Paracrocinitomix mangrovi]